GEEEGAVPRATARDAGERRRDRQVARDGGDARGEGGARAPRRAAAVELLDDHAAPAPRALQRPAAARSRAQDPSFVLPARLEGAGVRIEQPPDLLDRQRPIVARATTRERRLREAGALDEGAGGAARRVDRALARERGRDELRRQ